MIERHDRSRFAPIAISFGPDDDGEMRRRLKGAFERFIDVDERSDLEAAKLIRSLDVDIAVDLMGFTQESRPGILACRPAPVQVAYLGYPGTTGAGTIDYILADRRVVPEEQRPFYSEHVVYLPDSYQPNDRRPIADGAPARSEAGLPERGFVFCSFNQAIKITPDIFDAWMRLLSRIEGSVLWLQAGHPAATANLRTEAARRGVDPDRLVFAARVPRNEDHLARHRLADLFLDTAPYNAHTSASDALWAGLPIVTCPGETFAARVAASLLYAVGLPDLVTPLARRIRGAGVRSSRPSRSASPRSRRGSPRNARPARCSTPTDTGAIVEAAYATMHERHLRGEPPEHFSVAAIED